MTIEELLKLARSSNASDLTKLTDYYKSQGLNPKEIAEQIDILKAMKGGSGVGNDYVDTNKNAFRRLLGNNAIGVLFDTADAATKIFAEEIGRYFESQLGSGKTGDAMKVFEVVKKNGLNIQSLTLESLKAINTEIIGQLKIESELYTEIGSKTGLIGELGDALREDMKTASIEAARYGISLKDIGQFYIDLVDQTGRFNLINTQTINRILPLSKNLNMNLNEFAKTIADFEKVGIGADKTIKSLEDVTNRSLSFGLSAISIAKGIGENIDKLNSYGFKNGVEGLEKMVRRSKEFRFAMNEVFSVADKVFEPEGAIEMVANLQMIGGAIGDLNDPLKLLYMSTNDIEGLQEALIGAANSIATYNEETKSFEITGVNLRRAKAQADALNMSYKEFSNLAIASAERAQAALVLNSKALSIDEDEKEFLMNLARMEDGVMTITLPKSLAKDLQLPTKLALDKFNDDIADQLLLNRKAFQEMSQEEMAMKQLTETERMSRGIDVIAAYAKIRGAELMRGVGLGLGENLYKDMKDAVDEYSKVIKANADNNIQETVKKGVSEYMEDPIGNTIKAIDNKFFGKPEEKKDTKEPTAQNSTLNVNYRVVMTTEDTLGVVSKHILRNETLFREGIKTMKGEYTNLEYDNRA